MHNTSVLIGRSIVFAALAIGILGVEASISSAFPRLLSSQETNELRKQYQQDLKVKGKVLRWNPRNDESKRHYEKNRQNHNLLNRSWQQLNHPAAPFIGVWSSPSSDTISIYPVQGDESKICIVSVAMEGDAGFYHASLSKNMILTSDDKILFIENGNLVTKNQRESMSPYRFMESLPVGTRLMREVGMMVPPSSESRQYMVNQFIKQEKCVSLSMNYQTIEKEQTIECNFSITAGIHQIRSRSQALDWLPLLSELNPVTKALHY